MKTNLLKSTILMLAITASMYAWGDVDPCNIAPASPQGVGTSSATFSWSTADNGDVVVTIAPGEGTTTAVFRATGFAGDVDQFKVLSGEGFATEENASKYFYEKTNVDGETTYVLYRTGNYNLPSPCKIKYNHGAIEWRTTVGETTYGNAYDNSSDYVYEYGTICGSELSTPSAPSIANGVITFSSVEGATSYKAYMYQGSSYLTSFNVTSGELISYLPYLAGTYQVRIRAFNNMQYSDFSAPVDMVLASNNTSGNLPPSSVNKRQVSGGSGTEVYVSLETDLVTGNLLGIISPINPADDEYVYWREDAIRIVGFTYNGETFSDYFDAEYTQSHQIPNVSKIDTIHFSPKTTGDHIPAYGGTISYSGGTLVWHYNNAGAWTGGVSFPDYTYGAGCGSLYRPIISNLTDAGVITFAAVTDATSYKVYVYNSNKEKVHEQTIANGGTIDYHPYLSDTYKVYLQAFGADDAYSAYSASVDWSLTGSPAYLPQSNWCETLYTFASAASNAENVNVTWATDVSGNILVTLSPVEGVTQTYATEFRAGGMNIANLQVGGVAASTYFTSSYSGAVNTFALIDPANRPTLGSSISYDGMIEYRTGGQNDAYPTMHFTYIYGSTCNGYNDHVAPVVTDFSVVEADIHEITFHVAATDQDDLGTARAIGSYEISSNNHGFVTTTVTPDVDGNFTVSGLKDNETYTFTIHAIDLIGNEGTANREATVDFNTALNLSLGRGDYCAAGATQGDNTARKAVDGKESTIWTSYDTGDAPSWWQVDLGTAYDVSRVVITFNDIAAAYNIEASINGTDWTTIVEGATASYGNTRTYSDLTMSAQYFKVTCPTSTRIGIKEFEVYATGFSVPDETNPTVAVTCPAKTYTSATLQITAADEDDAHNAGTITSIKITGDNGFAEQEVLGELVENQITLSGLKNNKTYHFTVTVMDKAGNEGTANIEVVLPFNTSYNIALDGTASAGYRENDSQTADKANDGSTSTKWNTYGVDNSEGGYGNNWWSVQLDAAYNLSRIVANYQDVGTRDFIIEGSMDGSHWYTICKGQTTATTGEFSYDVAAPAQYVRYTYGERYLAVYEFEVYASGFSTLTDAQPVVTYTKVGTVDDVTAEIEIDAVDITTMPITTYRVSGIGEDPIEVTASDSKITLTSLSQSTHYTVDIQAKDGSGNLSVAKQVEFTTAGSVSGLYCFAGFFGWDPKVQERARFTTTAEPGVLTLVVSNVAAGDQNFKLYNAAGNRCTWNYCGGESDHHFAMASAADVTFYATDEDHFICTADNLYLRGSLVGEDKALTWNEDHTVATWAGTLDLSGSKEYTIVKNNGGEFIYDHDFYTEVQTFDGDYTYGEFTLDVTKMTGTWDYVGLSFADDAENNSSIISAHNGIIANVVLNRNINADNTWYTLCLPFDMDADKVIEVFGASTIATLTGSEDRGSLIHLNFDYVDAIEAGKPYLIKVGENFTSGSTISDVTIKNVGPTEVGDDVMKFVGTYDKIMLTGENKRYVSANNTLYSPNPDGGSKIGAFRCYFTIPEDSSAGAPGRQAVIVFGPQTATGCENIATPEMPSKIMLNGVLYILRDGKTYNAQGLLVE